MTGKNSIGAMPLWKKLAFASPIVVIVLYAILKLQTISWVEILKQTIDMNFNAEVTYKSSFVDWQGNFGATDVEITQWTPDGEEERTYRVDKVTILTPGVGWMLKSAFGSVGDVAPDKFGIELENPRNVEAGDDTQGNYTNLPYDAKGCVADMLTPTDLRTMGVETKRNVTVRFDREGNDRSTITWKMRTEGAGEFDMRMHIGIPDKTEYMQLLIALEQAPLHAAELKFTDLGFIAKRNAYCAKKNNMTAAAFDTYHMQEVDRRLKEEHLWFNAATLAHYQDFAKNGGTLEIRTSGSRKVALMDFLEKNWVDQMSMFPTSVHANDKAPAPLAVTWSPNAAPVAEVEAAPVATPAAMVAPAPTPVAANGLPEAGATIAYAQLAPLIGRHIDVSTSYGSVRKGVLTMVGPLAISVQLDKDEGGLLLTMPADSIEQITYTPLESPPAAAPATAQKAKAP